MGIGGSGAGPLASGCWGILSTALDTELGMGWLPGGLGSERSAWPLLGSHMASPSHIPASVPGMAVGYGLGNLPGPRNAMEVAQGGHTDFPFNLTLPSPRPYQNLRLAGRGLAGWTA